jgi:four helix bundle protein
MKRNILKEKSYAFALRIVRVYKYLTEERHERILSTQLLRSGTSIGSNIEEAIGGQSRKDFISKLSISYKEARETRYWLELLTDSNYLSQKEYDSLAQDNEEILKLLGAIQRTIKKHS